MKPIKQIILEALRYFRQTLLKDVSVQNDSKHALSCAGAFDLQNTIVRSITRSGTSYTAKNANGDTVFTFDQQDNNTTYSAASGGGLSLSNNQFSIANSGVTAGTYGPGGNVTGSNGVQIYVPQITVNAQGRVTGLTNRTYTSVNTDSNTTYSDATTSARGLMSAADKTNLNDVVGWINRGQFTGNLNSTTITPGFYRLGAADSYSGTKPSPNPTWCLFIQSPAYHTQIIIDGSSAEKMIAWRDYTGSPASWGSWKKVIGTAQT